MPDDSLYGGMQLTVGGDPVTFHSCLHFQQLVLEGLSPGPCGKWIHTVYTALLQVAASVSEVDLYAGWYLQHLIPAFELALEPSRSQTLLPRQYPFRHFSTWQSYPAPNHVEDKWKVKIRAVSYWLIFIVLLQVPGGWLDTAQLLPRKLYAASPSGRLTTLISTVERLWNLRAVMGGTVFKPASPTVCL